MDGLVDAATKGTIPLLAIMVMYLLGEKKKYERLWREEVRDRSKDQRLFLSALERRRGGSLETRD